MKRGENERGHKKVNAMIFIEFYPSQIHNRSPRCPVCSHSLVCSENPFSIVGIGPIPVKEL